RNLWNYSSRLFAFFARAGLLGWFLNLFLGTSLGLGHYNRLRPDLMFSGVSPFPGCSLLSPVGEVALAWISVYPWFSGVFIGFVGFVVLFVCHSISFRELVACSLAIARPSFLPSLYPSL